MPCKRNNAGPSPRLRFAPSPSGDLHLGGAYVALAVWLRARVAEGVTVLRIEDLDPPRTVPGAADRIMDDLEWLGLDFDEGPRTGGPHAPYWQSARSDRYEAALDRLAVAGDLYPCTCSRTEINRIASAPHAADAVPAYPGVCRDPAKRKPGRAAALRLRVPDGPERIIEFEDLYRGACSEDVAAEAGDFVLKRVDGLYAYQLAVTVDDVEMRIDEVIRGDDLLSSTARQILLCRMLGGREPAYMHLPMVLGPDGERLAKRHQSRWRGSTVRELQSVGVTGETLLGRLGHALGVLASPAPISNAELIAAARETPVRPAGPWQPLDLIG